jgi:hypothetical protein
MDPKFKPSKTFFRYLKSEYSLSQSGYTTGDLPEDIQNSLLISAYGATAWIRSKKGAEWVFKIVGVEEIPPHNAYKYYYNPPHGEKRRIDTDHRLRIFRRVKDVAADIYRSALDIAKRVIYTEGWKVPSDDMIKFVLTTYRSWLRSSSGFDWAKSVFKSVMHVYVMDGIAYRCTSVSGEVYWMGQEHIVTEEDALQSCESCDMDFPCTDQYTGLGRLCNRCYAESFAEEEILAFCNRHECKNYNCENYLTDDALENVTREIKQLPIQWSG